MAEQNQLCAIIAVNEDQAVNKPFTQGSCWLNH